MVKKIMITIMLMVFVCNISVCADSEKYGVLNIGDKTIGDDWVCFEEPYGDYDYNSAWIPLRSVVETLGGEITWDGETRKIYIDYDGEEYVAELTEYKIPEKYNYPDDYTEYQMNVCNKKYEGMDFLDYNLEFDWYGGGATCRIIDDKTYVLDYNMIALLYYFGYYIDIDEEGKKAEIFPINERDYEYDQTKYPYAVSWNVNPEAKTMLSFVYDINVKNDDIINYDIVRNGDNFSVNIKFHGSVPDALSGLDWQKLSKVEQKQILPNIDKKTVYMTNGNYSDCKLYLVECENCMIAFGNIPKKEIYRQ